MKRILVGLVMLVALFHATPAQAQQGPCSYVEWGYLLDDFNQINPGQDAEYSVQQQAIWGFLYGILPAIGYSCQYEFQMHYEQTGVAYLQDVCGQQGTYCVTRETLNYIFLFLFYMAYAAQQMPNKALMVDELVELFERWNDRGDIKIKELSTIRQIADLTIPTIQLVTNIVNRRKKQKVPGWRNWQTHRT